jgi:hypothetical protein
MHSKHPVNPRRLRKVPSQFNWVDHRLVRDRRLDVCSHAAAALYLFLVVVADAQGLSYYSDPTLMQRLRMDGLTLAQARMSLIQADLIAWRKPIYQVLSLDGPSQEPGVTQQPAANAAVHISEILNKLRGKRP